MAGKLLLASLALALIALSGCSVLVDGTLAGRGAVDGGIDAARPDTGTPDSGPTADSGPASACNGLPNGVHCTMNGIDEPFVCIGGICQLSRCGDGALDVRVGSMHVAEVCDDGNDIAGDGCEADCSYSCTADTSCDDMLACDGVETCDTTHHLCANGTAEIDGTTCTVEGTTAVCHGGVCRAGACGDGTVDPGEQCDDHNVIDHDGCDADCTWTCQDDSACQDADACNGNEICDVTMHTCGPSTGALNCDDADACTTDACDAMMGCTHHSVLVDADGDHHFAITSACGGDDCDDTNANAYPGAPEPCGSTQDLNCDMSIGTPPTWYADCDRDGYAALTGVTTTSCTMPTAGPSSCSSGTWVSARPSTRVHDCLDTNSSAFPGQTAWFTTNATGLPVAYDYDCDGVQQFEFLSGNPPSGETSTCTLIHVGTLSACTGYVYYPSGRPVCGGSATASSCTFGIGCSRSTSTRVEGCH